MPDQPRVICPADLLTLEELAGRLKVRKSWIYDQQRSTCANPLPCYRVGRYLRFNWIDVCGWLESVKRGGKRGAR